MSLPATASVPLGQRLEGLRNSPVPVFPSPVAPGWNGSPRAFPRASHPALTSGHVGVGTGHRARTQATLYVIDLASNPVCLLNACDLVSHSWMQKSCEHVTARRRSRLSAMPGGCVPRGATSSAVALAGESPEAAGGRPMIRPMRLGGAPSMRCKTVTVSGSRSGSDQWLDCQHEGVAVWDLRRVHDDPRLGTVARTILG